MIIDLRELQDLRGTVEGAVDARVEDPVSGEIVVPCRVTVDYRQSQGMFHLHGVVAGEFRTACHRCLEAAVERIGGDFDVIVRRGDHDGEAGDDVMVLASHEHEVSVDPFVHETVVVNEPMVVLCREDCRGLCPTCGKNLNEGACECREAADPRWDDLRRMKLD